MPKRCRNKAKRGKNAVAGATAMDEDDYGKDVNVSSIDMSAYYEGLKREKMRELDLENNIKPAASKRNATKALETSYGLSDSMKRIMKELNEAQDEELIIDRGTVRNAQEKQHPRAEDVNLNCVSNVPACSSFVECHSEKPGRKKNEGHSNGTCDILVSTSCSLSEDEPPEKAELEKKKGRSNSTFDVLVSTSCSLAGEEPPEKLGLRKKKECLNSTFGILVHAPCSLEESSDQKKKEENFRSTYDFLVPASCSLSFEDERSDAQILPEHERRDEERGASEATGDGKRLHSFAESAETSFVDLADDLKTIPFDPKHVSTPLQRAFNDIDEIAAKRSRSRVAVSLQNKKSLMANLAPTSYGSQPVHVSKFFPGSQRARSSYWRPDTAVNERYSARKESMLGCTRRREKSGLVKVEMLVGGVERPLLHSILEDPETSAVALADDLASISFDQERLTTPLQVRLSKVKRDTLVEQRKQIPASISQPGFERERARTNGPLFLGVPSCTAARLSRLVTVDHETELLEFCHQTAPVAWRSAQGRFKLNFEGAVKLGEGSFGEVFGCLLDGQPIALKVVPVGGAAEKTFEDVVPEVFVSDMLKDLSKEGENRTIGFIGFPGAFVVKGRYPKPLRKAWDNWIELNCDTYNEDPSVYKGDQKYILMAFEVGGKDLESFKPDNILQAYSIVYQVAYALAVAEKEVEFEHRDLHCGNVLVSQCDDFFVEECLEGDVVKIRTYGVKIKIIDFTLSRMSQGTSVVYCDLNKDEEIFTGEGPLHCEYYRKMRKINGGDWNKFTPATNSLWTSYVARFLYNVMMENQGATDQELGVFLSYFEELEEGCLLTRFLCSKKKPEIYGL